ncbi:MAG: 6-phosphogluconolactonase [Acidimicrobiia bacterium]|jgi:6-phosphogluconolactonase
MTIDISPTPDAHATALADLVAARVAASSGTFTLGLAGGSTPQAGYRLLATRPVPWERVVLWLGDERWVPETHPDSNAAMVRRTLAGTAGARFVAPDFTLGDPDRAAAAYQDLLLATFPTRDGAPAPDLILLGLGDDGHTASLFPGTAALEERSRSYVANWVAAKDTWRLTATMPLLWSAAELVFVVAGEAKATKVAAVIEDEAPFPARQVAAGARAVTWLLDEAAASRLTNRRRPS